MIGEQWEEKKYKIGGDIGTRVGGSWTLSDGVYHNFVNQYQKLSIVIR